MAFGNDIVGGTTLLRPAIRSPNYVAGISGWTINRDGTSEFASGTFRGPVIVIDPATGNVLASIGANGNGSFQFVYATSDVIIGTLSVLSAITQAGRGVVGYFRTTGAVANIPGGNVFADILWCSFTMDATRQYRVSCLGGRINNTNVSNSEDYFSRLVVAQPGGVSGTFGNGVSTTAPNTLAGIQCAGFISSSVSGPATVKLQMSNDSASTAYPIITTDGMTILVEDIGPKITGNGGTGSPSGTTQFTTQYFATASQSYASPSGASESDPNNLYIGQLAGRTNGSSENAVWCFPGGTIRTDISGATIQSAKLWMYCTGSSKATGSTFLGWITNSSPPATVPGSSTGGSNRIGNWATVPSWGSVDISGELSQITGNLANGVLLQPSGLTGSASWYGAGNATFKPYIEITYTK